jgi:A/G-specific adenine glycosylase
MAREVDRRGGVPPGPDELMALPGVGRYAANATQVVAFGRRAPVVDGVTARVYRRYLGLPSDLPATADPELWRMVDLATPRDATRDWNWAVLDLAAEICLPARPRCDSCPLVERCAYGSQVA